MKQALLIPVVGGLLALAGCAGGYGYYSTAPPPPLRVEAYGAAPGPGYVWVNGYWSWQRNNYVWMPGRWSRAPRRGATWVEPRWELRNGRYRFRQGRWR